MSPVRILLIGLLLISGACWAENSNNITYVAMKPAFVVNVNDGEEVHHLQLSISFIPNKPEMANIITQHEPAIRHAIVVLLSGQQVADINTAQGKILLREKIQQAVNEILKKNSGHSGIKRTLITGFLIQ